MTIICACRDPEGDRTWIGSDTLAVNSGTKMPNGPKWVVRGEWAIGHAGDKFAYNALCAHADKILHDPAGAWTVANRVRSMIQQYGFNPDQQEGVQTYGQQMIVAHPGGVWSVGCDFSVIEIADGALWADGCGRPYALGAGTMVSDPRDKVMYGVAAATRYDINCGGDLWLQRLVRAT